MNLTIGTQLQLTEEWKWIHKSPCRSASIFWQARARQLTVCNAGKLFSSFSSFSTLSLALRL
jgi:hypothetical protein